MMMPLPLRGVGRPHHDNTPDELHIAVLTGRCKRIKALLRKGVHIESVNSLGQTPLFCASWGGDVEVVELLLGLGANPNRRCGTPGATPVHAAAYRGSRRVLRLLIEAGADLSVKDKDNLTPRDYADRQPHPIRRQKILVFLDLILAMTLHRGRPFEPLGHPSRSLDTSVPPTPANTLSRRPPPGFASPHGDACLLADSRLSLSKSSLSLSKKGLGSMTSVWAACVGAGELPRDKKGSGAPNSGIGTLHRDFKNAPSPVKSTPSVAGLHKSVSCHLVDQLCVTTSLPLLSPTDLQRPTEPGLAYTCGGPTVYSPYTWLGTPVTVRRPTPAFSIARDAKASGKPDQDAVMSLLEELAILRRIRHPAFLEVMAACHVKQPAPDHVTLVFQHVPHGSLYHHLHVMHRDLSVAGAVEVLVGVVEGLLFLHAHGWLHSGLSSHALHLVSTSHAKLGSFQHAIQQQAKGGCSMKAEEMSRATWLVPWQAPEVIAEAMVSIKSEVYALAAIIWEIWSGMPPWCGLPEEEIKRRVTGGDCLPFLTGTPPSLVMYLTQYGLKWNAHERDLDLHEIHTMLRSLRVQVDDDERVPAVTAWGPPSVPNTPVVGRTSHSLHHPASADSLASLSGQASNSDLLLASSPSCYPSTSARSSSEIHPSQYLQFVTIDQSMLTSSSSSCSSVHVPVSQASKTASLPRPLEAASISMRSRRGPAVATATITETAASIRRRSAPPDGALVPTQAAIQVHNPPSHPRTGVYQTNVYRREKDGDCPVTRMPSPPTDATSSAKLSSSITTSNPMRHTPGRFSDLPPDLLPSKFLPNSFLQTLTPDILTRGKQEKAHQQTPRGSKPRPSDPATLSRPGPAPTSSTDRTHPASDSEGDPNQEYAFISNTAKRAFFTDSDGSNSKSPSPTHDRTDSRVHWKHRSSVDSLRPCQTNESNKKLISYDKEIIHERSEVASKPRFEAQDTKGPIRSDVVRRGLSLSNLLNIGMGSMVTRTFSHVSLCSAESSATSSSGAEPRRPHRTISQVTLTFKKLSTADSSSSSSSRDELEQASKNNNNSCSTEDRSSSRYRRAKSLPKSPPNCKSPRQWEEVTAIKPASHQLTRHSSSCSLSSGGPPSPVHQFVGGAGAMRSNHASLPSSPQHSNAPAGLSRPSSLYSAASLASLGETAAIRVNPRRHSEANKPRQRRLRRKPDIEPEEEFIDDEFNSALYEQPHMQLSVGSSENLLDTRLTATSMMADDSALYQCRQGRKFSCPSLTATGDLHQPLSSRLQYHSPRQSTLNVLPENSDEDLSLPYHRDPSETSSCSSNPLGLLLNTHKTAQPDEGVTSKESSTTSDKTSDLSVLSLATGKDQTLSDTDSVVSYSPGMSDFRKEYEPLKSVQLLKNMGKSLSLYLPKHSMGSDSEIENL